MTVNVFKPKKSNLTKPAFSADTYQTELMVIKDLKKHLYKGTTSVNFLSAITTPAVRVATFLLRPSNCKERSINFFTLGFSLINSGSAHLQCILIMIVVLKDQMVSS